VRRRRTVRRGSWASFDPVAGLRDGLDDRWVAELCSESTDRDLDGLGERVGGVVPDAIEELFGRDDAPLGGEQQFEDAELLG
jgi:hypothetical protein